MPEQEQFSREGKMAARAGETMTKILRVQACAMTSVLSLLPLPHQLGSLYFDRIKITEI